MYEVKCKSNLKGSVGCHQSLSLQLCIVKIQNLLLSGGFEQSFAWCYSFHTFILIFLVQVAKLLLTLMFPL